MNRVTEADIQSLIMSYLDARRVFAWRQNTGTIRKNGRVIRFGIKGQADITGILPDGRRLEIEVKRDSAQSREQKNFADRIRSSGGVYILAHCVEDVAKVIEG